MKRYLKEKKKEISAFETFDIRQVPQGGNTHANSLTILAVVVSIKIKIVISVSCLPSPSIFMDLITSAPPKITSDTTITLWITSYL